MKKFVVLLMSLLLIFPLAACGKNESASTTAKEGKEKKEIIVGTSGEYYPWAFKKNDKLQGFEIDVWSEIAKRNNLEIKYKTSKFSGLIGMLDAGKIDTIAHQMSITKERLKKYNFTEPYAYSYYDFVVKEDSSIKSAEDLKDKKVACWLGGNGEKTLRNVNESKNLNIKIVTYDGAPIEKEVEIGRVEAGWQGEVKTKSTIDKENLPLKLIGARLAFETNAYPFVKNDKNKELLETVSKTIKEMHEDGTLKKISNKWFKLDTTAKPE